ncbi:TPD1 protein homolog 1 isoform X2 [Cryptomeria japonica]|uniref:TPD1 protein homolog 1 isoform X2 n=1 Tax=Cryptomeria japonica TaxID=3369 RepID=UPI0025AD9AD0|nr:TPD1 protein homolog 1 isoform X2 [Cryptomeria japonica]
MGTVHIGDYYNVQILNNNVSENMENWEKVGLQPVFRNRRLKVSGACTNKDISISQSSISTPGIPEFIVQIVNTCMSGCSPSHIHVHCGWFASAKMVNPNVFRRLKYDDCLVNGGKPLKSSQIIRFTYSNTFLYPLSFKSASFC